MVKKTWLIFFMLVLLSVFVVVGCGTDNTSTSNENDPGTSNAGEGPVEGGTLKVVIDAEPPTLDMHVSTTTLVYNVGWHMFEQLYTLDEEFAVIPMLAEDMPEISVDKLTYKIKLREGVTFHNGKKMTSADVIASIKRWGEVSGNGRSLFAKLDSIEADGDYGVILNLNEPIGTVLVYLAIPNGGAVIYPEEIVSVAGAESVKEFIGTGPYEFVEWESNQFIKLAKFEGYQPVDFESTGYGGAKAAYVDELYFYPVSDASVRIASVESGDFHFADFVPVDMYDQLKETPGLEAIASQPRGWFSVVFNKKEGVMSDKLIRQAFLAALDMEPIMDAGYGHRDFWRLSPSIMFKEQVWYSEAGSEYYNQKDIERAKELLEKSGYNGEPIRWITGPLEYNFSLATKNQLEQAGFVVELERMEWATVTERRGNPELWDAFSTGFTFRADPTMMVVVSPTYAGWWENDELQSLLDEIAIEEDFEVRFKLWEQVQELFYDDVPTVKIGDYSNLRILRDNVKGFTNMNEIFFWNVWVE